MPKLLRHWPLLFVFFILLVFFLPVFQGKLPIPADALVGLYHPYRDFYADKYPSGIPYKNFLLTDPVLQQYPWKKFAISQLKQGQIPWWNPYTHSGMPLLANFQAGVFYPLNFIFWLFSFPAAWTVYIVLQPFLGALFLYLFLRHHQLKPLSAALGSLSWVLGSFFLVWLEWGNLGHTLAWLPLSLLMIDKYARTKKFKFIIFNALVLSTSFFAGHLQVAFYVILSSLAYAVYRKVLWPFGLSYLFLALITSIQSLPTLQLIKVSARDIDQAQILTRPDWFLPWQHLAQTIAPDFFGNPATLNYFGVWNYAEFVSYIGLIPFILVLLAIFSKPGRKLGLTLLAILLFTLPTPIAKLPFRLNLPFISQAQPSRLLSLVTFILAILAALGFDQILRRRKLKLKLCLTLVATALLALWLIAFTSGSTVSLRNLVIPTGLFIAFGLIRFANWQIGVVILIFSATDLLRFATKFTPFSLPEYLYPQTSTIKFLQDNLGDYRYLTTDRRILPPNAAMVYGLKTIEGYDPLYLKSYASLITQMESGQPEPIQSFNRIIRPTNFDSPIINQLGVKYILTLDDLENPQFKKVFQEGQTRVYQNTSLLK